MLSRRQVLLTVAALGVAGGRPARGAVEYPAVVPRPLRFPADHGAHPDFRTEWWYLTGWLGPPEQSIGFQVTFFRVRTDVDPANPSVFAARQLLIAHAAIADPRRGRLLVDERVARTGLGLVDAATGDTDVGLEGWSLKRDPATDTYRGEITAREFRLAFTATPGGPPWLQGDAGLSRKGPLPAQASYYYSRPQLAVTASLSGSGFSRDPASIAAEAAPTRLTGVAWLDHEWSSTALAPDAAGWDWTGMNLADGSALLAFQVRRRAATPGEPPLWRYAAWHRPDGTTRIADPATVGFEPLDHWTSARTGARWPVAQRLRVDGRTFDTRPLLPDQELDSRLTTGAVYWEGASTLLEAGRPVGRGYLEMTGYVSPLTL